MLSDKIRQVHVVNRCANAASLLASIAGGENGKLLEDVVKSAKSETMESLLMEMEMADSMEIFRNAGSLARIYSQSDESRQRKQHRQQVARTRESKREIRLGE